MAERYSVCPMEHTNYANNDWLFEKIVEKTWGKEYWIDNQPEYCLKYLEVIPGQMCSLHYHPIKTETHIILTGEIFLELGGTEHPQHVILEMKKGDRHKIYAKTPHRFWSGPQGGLILEISTSHSEVDVVRLIKAGPIEKSDQ
jgi:mannose-6-phosphate isomerase